MFHEGDILKVWLKKQIQLPDDKEYYLVEDENKNRFMIPVMAEWQQIFQQYDNFICRVDKINCSGKIYLEPMHPHYQIGQSYPFRFTKLDKVKSDLEEVRYLLFFTDEFNNSITLLSLSKPNFAVNSIVNARIAQIKKGTIIIEFRNVHIKNLWIGDTRKFEYLGKQNSIFIFKDEFGYKHSLKKDVYDHYGFEIGKVYEGTVLKYNKNYSFKIEPKNPFYELGKEYSFKFRKIKDEVDLLNNSIKVIEVEDIWGHEATIVQFSEDLLKSLPKEYIEAKINRISNGRLYLEIG